MISLKILSLETGQLIVGVLAFYLQMYVGWFIYKHTLKISGWLAFGITAFELLFNLTILQIILKLIGRY